MRTLNLITLQGRYQFVTDEANQATSPASDQIRNLVEVVRLYRKQEEAYYSKVKRREFAKDELHFLMKTKQKLDSLLSTIQL